MVKEGRNGHIFGDEQDLAEKMIDLAKNQEKLQGYQQNLAEFRNDTWEVHWRNVVPPVIG